MREAELPIDEANRIRRLLEYQILDTPTEETYDQITELASRMCGMPIALVSLVDDDRQWFKSRHGLDAEQTPRSVAFCSHAILQDEVFEIPNSFEDDRFHDNPLVTGAPNVVAYAGAPLVTPTGEKVGTLCVIDNSPHALTEDQRYMLKVLADQVVTQMELRKSLSRQNELLDQQMGLIDRVNAKNEELGQFAYQTSHDLKAPVIRIQGLASFCLKDLDAGKYAEVRRNLEFVVASSKSLSTLVEDIIDLTRADLYSEPWQAVDVQEVVSSSVRDLQFVAQEQGVEIRLSVSSDMSVVTQPTRLQQILYNLISNSVKYANKDRDVSFVDVAVSHDVQNGLVIDVSDNGLGIPSEFHSRVFDMFERFHPGAASGSGLGTAIMKKHVDALDGLVSFESDESGTQFRVTLPMAYQECAA